MIDTEKIENKCLIALQALQDIISEITAVANSTSQIPVNTSCCFTFINQHCECIRNNKDT